MQAAGAVLLGLYACFEPGVFGYQGYAEGEYVLISAPAAGTLDRRFAIE